MSALVAFNPHAIVMLIIAGGALPWAIVFIAATVRQHLVSAFTEVMRVGFGVAVIVMVVAFFAELIPFVSPLVRQVALLAVWLTGECPHENILCCQGITPCCLIGVDH